MVKVRVFVNGAVGAMFCAALTTGLATTYAKEIHDLRSAGVGSRDRRSVTASNFYAAEIRRAEHWRDLCDPARDGDGNTGGSVACSPRGSDGDTFLRKFARGRLNGEPRMSGDHVRLAFAGDQSETKELLRRCGHWYPPPL